MARNLAGTRTIAGNRFLQRDYGSSGSFNGTDNYLDIGTLGTLGSSLANGFSISFWLLSQQRTAGTILGTRISSTNNYLLVKVNTQSGSNAAGYMQVQFSDTSGSKSLNGYARIAQVNNGNWHHIVATLMPSTNTITAYIDNVSQTASYTTQQTPDTFANFSRNIYLGALNNNGTAASPFYKGLLDEVTLWNQILTPTEVTELYYKGYLETNPLSYHKFNENSGSSVADSVSNNTGTWNGTLGSQWSSNVVMTSRGVA